MEELLKYKDWLTIKDASKILSCTLGEKVRQKDIYRLAIEDKLTLSVYFVNNTYLDIADNSDSLDINNLQFSKRYKLIKAGTYLDLSTSDNCKLILKQHYYNHSNIPLKLTDDKGIICTLADHVTPCRLISYKEQDGQLTQVTTAHQLPLDTYLVIKTKYLIDFAYIVKHEKKLIRESLELQERISLYKIALLLAASSDLPIKHPYKVADILINQVAPKIGITPPHRDTIAKYLKEAHKALS